MIGKMLRPASGPGWRHGLPGSPACLECEGRQQCRPFLAAPLLPARRSNRMAWRIRSNVPLIVPPGSGSGRASQTGEMLLAHAQSTHRPKTGKDRPAFAADPHASRPSSAGTDRHVVDRRWRQEIFSGGRNLSARRLLFRCPRQFKRQPRTKAPPALSKVLEASCIWRAAGARAGNDVAFSLASQPVCGCLATRSRPSVFLRQANWLLERFQE